MAFKMKGYGGYHGKSPMKKQTDPPKKKQTLADKNLREDVDIKGAEMRGSYGPKNAESASMIARSDNTNVPKPRVIKSKAQLDKERKEKEKEERRRERDRKPFLGMESPMKKQGKHKMPDGTMMLDSAMKKSYTEAYKDADKEKYKTKEAFIKAAKAYNMDKYGTTEPTRDSKKMGVDKSKLKAAIASKSTMPAVEVKPAKVNPDGTKRGSSSVVGKTRSDASVVSKAGNQGTTGGNRKSSSVVGKSRSDASVVSSKTSAEANKKKRAANKLARQKKNAADKLARQKKRADKKASPAKKYKKY